MRHNTRYFKLVGIGALMLFILLPVDMQAMSIPSSADGKTEEIPVHSGGAPQPGKGQNIPALAIAAGVFVVASTIGGYVLLSDDERDNDTAGRLLMVPAASIGLGWMIATIGY